MAQGIGNDLKADFPCLGGVHANGLGHQRLVRFPGYGLHGVYVCSVRRGVLHGTIEEWGGGGRGREEGTHRFALNDLSFEWVGHDNGLACFVGDVCVCAVVSVVRRGLLCSC